MYASQELQLRQSMTLAPRLRQSVKLLQMSTLEFQQAVQHALASNPFLEGPDNENGGTMAVTDDPATLVMPADDADIPSASPTDDSSVIVGNVAISAAEPQSAYPGDYPRQRAPDDGDGMERQAATGSLREHLIGALGTLSLAPRDRLLIIYLIDSLDADGYLRQAPESLAQEADFDPPPEDGEWRAALHHVQHLLGSGIGARDLRECLLLQLEGLSGSGMNGTRALAIALVKDHLARLARSDWPGLRRELGVDDAALRGAVQLIRALDPRPGRRYDDQPTHYVIPDVVVDRVAGRWRVRLNEAAMSRVRLHRQYVEWFSRARCAERAPMARELQEAQWLVHNIEQRHTTILRVANVIVLRQWRFLDYGDVALRPLLLREMADDLGVHESTISRATANKYMITPRGVFEFRHFFSRELETESGGTCSANAVRALIRELIEGEDSFQPLSDVDITQQLARHGIIVARRTVTKYRGQLRMPAVEVRRGQTYALW